MNWAKTNSSNGGGSSWDSLDDWGDSSGGGGGDKKWEPRRFYVPPEKGKRIMILGALDPNSGDWHADFCQVFEHNMYWKTKKSDKEMCLVKNGNLDSRGCPLCKAAEAGEGSWASFTGYLTVIDMGDVSYAPPPADRHTDATLTGWTSDKGVTYQFDRKLYGAKRGGKDKPGVLKKLQREMQRTCIQASNGRQTLAFSVWDVYRSGRKTESVGDELQFMTQLKNQDEAREYLIKCGADPEKLDLEVCNYLEMDTFKPSSYEDLARLVGMVEGDEEQGARSDEAVPF